MRTGWLQGLELYALKFNAGLEAVFTPDLRNVIRDLERLADFIRWEVVVATQSIQAGNIEGGKASVFVRRRNTLDSILCRNAIDGAFRAKARGMQVSKSLSAD